LTGELSLEEEGRGGERGGERERKGRGEGKKGCRREEERKEAGNGMSIEIRSEKGSQVKSHPNQAERAAGA
jgi:hypothetical protein